MTAHTPGPGATCLDCTVLPPFSIRLCRLHAAAPEMLHSLYELLDTMELNMDDMEDETRAVITLARTLLARIDGDAGAPGGATA